MVNDIRPVDDFCDAIEGYYQVKYTIAVRDAIVRRFAKMSNAYKLRLYDAVVEAFTANPRKPECPDLATIVRVSNGIGDTEPRVDRTRQLPEPEQPDLDPSMAPPSPLDAGEEIKRIGMRKMRGDATRDELHWLWCVEENHGVWVPPWNGPYAELFGAKPGRDAEKLKAKKASEIVNRAVPEF